MKVRILISSLLVLFGIGIIIYPWLRAWQLERQKDEIVEQWLEVKRGSSEAYAVKPTESPSEETRINVVYEEEEMSYTYENLQYIKSIEGILTIEAIDLRTPISSEYTESNLKLAVCRLKGSVAAGDFGNYCIAGHKNRVYGRHFNRLKEVSSGDIIVVETDDAVYSYNVIEVLTITPDDIWVLKNDFDKKRITLITCDYSLKPTGRFIVRGELIEE